MTTSLVTGGAGFIGSHVVKHLLDMGHEVVVLDDLSGGSMGNLPGKFRFEGNNWVSWPETLDAPLIVKASILETDVVDHIFAMYHPDYVFHLAAYAAEGLSHFIRNYNYEVNVIGSVNLINAAVNVGTVKRFVFTSSAAVYGPMGPIYASENLRPEPADPYGVAKLAVELDLVCAYEMFGLPYTIFRCHNVYGSRQNLNDCHRNVVAIFMRQVLRGEKITIFGDGSQTRQFTYIDDVAPVIANCIDLPQAANQTFNVGSSKLATVNGVAAWVAMALNPSAEKVHLPARHEVAHIQLDHHKFTDVFGDKKWTEPWDGIQQMAQWAKTQQLREPQPFAAIEIEKNLPESWRKLYVH